MIDVIIADDDANVRRGLEKIIKWEEHDARIILVAKNGKEVAEMLNKKNADLIISDVKMPLMDGIELSRYVKAHSPDTVMVLLSAYAEFEYAQEALKYGVREYVLKPVDREKIQHLSNIIGNVAKEKRCKQKLNFLIHNTEFRQNIKKALEDEKIEYLNEITNLNEDYKSLDVGVVREYYLLLLEVLDEYIKSVGIRYLSDGDMFKEIKRLSGIEEFKEFTIKQYMDAIHFRNIIKKRQKNNIVEYVKIYINDKYSEQDLSTSSIAATLKLSVPYLSSLFREAEGITLTEYITKTRIEKAIKLLNETGNPVNKVAAAVGYEDMRYFAKVFKKITGMSPSEYRFK